MASVLKNLRNARGLSQEALGLLVGMTQSQISYLERTGRPTKKQARALSIYFGVSRKMLFPAGIRTNTGPGRRLVKTPTSLPGEKVIVVTYPTKWKMTCTKCAATIYLTVENSSRRQYMIICPTCGMSIDV